MNNLLKSNEIIYEKITDTLIDMKLSISTMESCTAGLIATLLTNRLGASAILKGAFVTYSNEAKIKQGVNKECIDKYGVYSKQTAIEMAKACKKQYDSYFGIGVTGIIDRPDPNNITNNNKVYYAIVYNDKIFTHTISIPNNIKNRWDRKLYVANNIGVYLTDILMQMKK